jgi:lipoprotein-anchoring transpeptidase ErfK/SrfK
VAVTFIVTLSPMISRSSQVLTKVLASRQVGSPRSKLGVMNRQARLGVLRSENGYVPPERRNTRRWVLAMVLPLTVVVTATVSACGPGTHEAANTGVISTLVPQHHWAAPSHQPGRSAPKTNPCARNTRARDVLVSISRRRLWACAGARDRYEVSVITGMENIPADLTPTGVYRIYTKQTNLYLNGSDSTGSWHDWVHFWMPFLINRYGVYGLHDATWRRPAVFGAMSPYSSHASHGCVELPLRAARWLYNWAHVGTTATVVD